ncbi:DUF3182 family protein [Paracoccus sp. CPCC 101403]|uniref:DUF3182 family protein n=1 Tax=Paracoccus broussonetiae TaxID=3075834 RepID=A0ABU3EDG6_9RHOB|nr:DUF3182 family protein [Paracoccus sp. CPCC 101403]MDT1062273.1 DUF3182 family protein [Paracoccus sp. CPCC 101403]
MNSILDPAISGPQRLVLTDGIDPARHADASLDAIGRRLARHLGLPVTNRGTGNGDYAVPRTCLAGPVLRPASPCHFLGGWVQDALHATKAIVHPLVGNPACVPAQWPGGLSRDLAMATLPGFTVFSAEDALAAGRQLLQRLPRLRVKQVPAEGGQGQAVAHDLSQLSAVLDGWGDHVPSGLVIEEDIAGIRTFSVGQTEVPGQTVAYVGVQSTTPNSRGEAAYGGSTLLFIRGTLHDLAAARLPWLSRMIVARAAAFDQAADRHLGLMASRRNYDVALGRDSTGVARVAVLEQSWCVGGATPAELLALEEFAAAPQSETVITSTIERYGPDLAPPPDAFVLFDGCDPTHGAMLKYAVLGEGKAQEKI